MSVSIGAQGAQTYVELKHGGQAIQVPVENKEQAKQAAKEMAKVEAEMIKQEKKLGKTPEEFMVYLQEQAVKQQGTGEKLDKTV